ncbi:Pputative serine protease [Tieghemostelium lacteum]|uniref:Pputative serine protease n=1 Tax=Tieghemostelium lacteum TaxID=361077 RepID=A0A151ZDB1_TIELA|nr:Pputative serine protease [Tieghemostelium lacteum]|eukprot:KYQ91942.1 Pputative serine protease [Tieghemostelium lacteum]
MKIILAVILLICINNTFAFRLNQHSSLNKGLKYRGVDIKEELESLKFDRLFTDSSSSSTPQSQWFTQQLDHFDPLNDNTFQQQFLVNDTYWDQNGPIFILLGGEGPIAPSYVQGHFILNTYAEKFNALIVAVEHRGYGQSVVGDLDINSGLKYITVEQALADYATFRQYIVEKYSAYNNKWVSFGGSYSGSLSAWFRLKYPQLIDAAIATSAPVQAQLDFSEYFEVVSRSLGPECSAMFKNITNTVTEMIQQGQNQQVEELFQACDPIESELDFATFMESLSGGPSEIVQYNNDNKATFTNITTMCTQIGQSSNPLEAFAEWNQQFNIYSGSNCTTSSYQSFIQSMQETDPLGDNAAAIAWTWQTCIEFGYYQDGESPNQPFSSAITLDYFVQQCTDIFGPSNFTYQPAINWINTEYGARNLQTSNIVMANGFVDPWSSLGIINSTDPSIQTILIPTGAHCSDLYAPLPTDSAALQQARSMAVNLISQIVSQ